MKRFFDQIIRRKVIPVAVAYIVGAWVLLQVGDTLIGLLELPGWTGKAMVAVALAGLPIALVLSWIYDWTPKGIVVTDAQTPATPAAFAFSDPSPFDPQSLDLAVSQSSRIIGRNEELATIRDSLESARNASGGIVLIGGEPGVGKSRLGEEALSIGRQSGMLPLTGHAYEDRGAPYITSIEILEETMHVLPDDVLKNSLGNTAPEIARLLPALRLRFPGIVESADVPVEQQQRFLFNSVLEFLKRLGAGCPVVILLDDLHWADESSIQLLEFLTPHVQQLPILFVVTYRDVEADMGEPFKRVLVNLSREPGVTRINLRRFSRDDVQSLLQVLSGHEPPGNLVDSIHEETNGNAFYVQSVYQHLADEKRLFDSDGEWLADLNTATLEVPDSVRLVTGRRIARLSQATQGMLNVAAVMGMRFRLPLLEAINSAADDTIACVEEAESAHLIKRSAGERELRYEFVHAIARHTVLGELSAPRRQKLHLTIAEAIEANNQQSLDAHAADLSFHLSEAGDYADPDKVTRWLNVAGENAVATVAMEEAVDYFNRALAIIGEAETEIRADILRRRGAAQLSFGKTHEVLEDLEAALSLYELLGLVDKAAHLATSMAYVLIWTAQPGKAHKLVKRGLAMAPEENEEARCNLISVRALAHSYDRQPGDATASKTLHQQAVNMARRLNKPLLLADMLQNQGLDCWVRLDKKGAEVAREAAAILRSTNQQHWKVGQCRWIERAGLAFGGQFEEAVRFDDDLEKLGKRNGDCGLLGCKWLVSCIVELSRGDPAAASAALKTSTDWFEAGGFPWGMFNAGYDAVVLSLAGRFEEARAAVNTVAERFIGNIVFSGTQEGYWLSAKAELGDSDILEQFHKHSHNLPQPNSDMAAGAVIFLKGAIEALIVAGEKDEAATLYPLINEFIEQDLGHVEFAFGIHDRTAGMAAAAAKKWDEAEQHFRRALELADTLPHRVDQARVRTWFARMLLDRDRPGDRDQANDYLAEARRMSEEMGLLGLTRRIDTFSS